MKKKQLKYTKGFLAFQKRRKKLTLAEAMKYELIALQLKKVEDEEVIFVYKYGQVACFFEIRPRTVRNSFLVPSTIMDAYLEKLDEAQETLYEFIKEEKHG